MECIYRLLEGWDRMVGMLTKKEAVRGARARCNQRASARVRACLLRLAHSCCATDLAAGHGRRPGNGAGGAALLCFRMNMWRARPESRLSGHPPLVVAAASQPCRPHRRCPHSRRHLGAAVRTDCILQQPKIRGSTNG